MTQNIYADGDLATYFSLWDEAALTLDLRGTLPPARRLHSWTGADGCTAGDVDGCPACAANGRAHAAYHEALFAEMARLRQGRVRL